jgi:hypothetical protein
MNTDKYTVSGNDVHFNSGYVTHFPFPVGECVPFNDVLVVRLEVPRDTIFNENIYGLDYSGNVIWQIKPVYPDTEDGTWGSIQHIGQIVVACNFRGLWMSIRQLTGEIIEIREQLH